MTERIIDISDAAPILRVKNMQLALSLPASGQGMATPLVEVVSVVISNPAVMMSQGFVAELTENGGMLVVCNRAHVPVGMMLPLRTHSTQSVRFASQARMGRPLKKRIWAQIVRAKIIAQGRLLQSLYGQGDGLILMARRVKSGDVGNLESQAARRYWPVLFQDNGFRRERDALDQNRLLNYGYAVLRATVARALCVAGLHPTLGLQHHNRGNPFCLADDLMEPYRPLVDAVVVQWLRDHKPDAVLDAVAKKTLLSPFLRRYAWGGEERSFFDWMAQAASSLAQCVMGSSRNLLLPELQNELNPAVGVSSYVACSHV